MFTDAECDTFVGGIIRRKLPCQKKKGGFPPRTAVRRVEKMWKEYREDALQTR